MTTVCSELHVPSRIILHSRVAPCGCDNKGMDLRDRIRAAIAAKEGATVRNVSLAAGLSDSALHKFLTGSTKSITVDSLEGIAKALDVSLRYLMFGDEDSENVTHIWDRIPARDKERARRILETLAEDSESLRA